MKNHDFANHDGDGSGGGGWKVIMIYKIERMRSQIH